MKRHFALAAILLSAIALLGVVLMAHPVSAAGRANRLAEPLSTNLLIGSVNCPLPQYNPTHFGLQPGQTVTCTIPNASLKGSPSTVTVYIQSSTLGNQTVTGTVSGSTITFTYTGRSDGCVTTDIMYDNGAGKKTQAHAGFAFVNASGQVLACGISGNPV